MNLRPVFNAIKRFFKREEIKSETKITRMSLVPPKDKPKTQTFKFNRGRTRGGVKKHPLHSHHFGNFSPLKPI
jgi:hypothetical protein